MKPISNQRLIRTGNKFFLPVFVAYYHSGYISRTLFALNFLAEFHKPLQIRQVHKQRT